MKNLFILLLFLLLSGCKKEGFYVNIKVEPKEGGTVVYSKGPYQDYDEVKLDPVPTYTYKFIGWTGEDASLLTNSKYIIDKSGTIIGEMRYYAVKMHKNISLQANFEEIFAESGLWAATYSVNNYIIKFYVQSSLNQLTTACGVGTAPNGKRMSIYLYSFSKFDNYLIDNISVIDKSFTYSKGDINIGKITITGTFTSFTTCIGTIIYEKGTVVEKYEFNAEPCVGFLIDSPYWIR